MRLDFFLKLDYQSSTVRNIILW